MWFDPAAIDAMVELVPPWLALLLALVSFLGSAVLLTPLLLGWYTIRPRERVLAWIGVLFGAYSLRAFIKLVTDIDRPPAEPGLDPGTLPFLVELLYIHPVGIDTPGFPSGHVVAAIVFWGLLAVDLDRGTAAQRIASAVGVVIVVAISRVLLGAHWVEDVLGGAIIGLALLLVFLWGRRQVDDEVLFAFGLAGVLASLDLLVVGALSSQAVFAASWGVFVGLAVQSRTDWPSSSPLSPRPPGIPTAASIAGVLVLALVAVVNPPTDPVLFAVAPVAAIGIHWDPARLSALPTVGPVADRP